MYPGYDQALAATHAALAKLPRPPAMLGPEVLGIHHGLLDRYVKPMNLDLVAGIAHHIYEMGDDKKWDWLDPGPDSFVDEMQSVAKLGAAAAGKPIFQTEFSTQEDRGVLGGFESALLVHHSLVEEGVVAFLWWDLFWVRDGGVVSIDKRPLHRRDQYYSMRHYARFTDPGDVRVGARTDADRIRATAFLSPRGDRLTAIVINSGDQAADVRIDTSAGVTAGGGGSAVYRTVYRPPAGSEPWKELGALPATGVVALPGRSIATVVWSVAKKT